MCGIAGAAGIRAEDVGLDVAAALRALHHRGPDASAMRTFNSCTLGHARLRIIDLREAADEPIANEDESVWLTFNGEIYNFGELRAELLTKGHRFRSDGDGEVIVHLYEDYGDDLVHHLRGMFAFAIWDDRAQRLLLARDRLGIKPMYYAQRGDGVVFASESRVLRTPTTAIDRVSLASYLRLGWVPAPRTIFAGINELPPGHLLTWSGGHTNVVRWWQPPRRERQTDATDELRNALLDGTRRHLVADVPVGVFLSAGLDSVAIATLAAEVGGHDVRTYTVAFEGANEAAAAASVATRLGLGHEVVDVSGTEIVTSLDDIVAAMDQPTVDGVNSWVISHAVRDAGCTVALSGLGGDELFAGYSTFRRVPVLARAGRIPARLGQATRDVLVSVAGAVPHRTGRRAGEAIATGGWAPAYAAMRGAMSRAELSRVWDTDSEGDGVAGVTVVDGLDDLDTVTQLELRNYLPSQLLRDTDAMSMAHSLEVRVPLLDDDVVRVALEKPTDAAGRSGKARLAAAVDPTLLERAAGPKQTFTLPFDAWVRGPLEPTVRGALDNLGAADVGLRKDGIAHLWRRWQQGRAEWRTIWTLAVLGMWLDQQVASR